MAKSKTPARSAPKAPRAPRAPKTPKPETPTPTPCPIPTTPEMPLHGEIITFSMHGQMVPHTILVDALKANALTTSVIREIVPRDAFARACRSLRESRIIRRLQEDDARLTFQFTKEHRTDEGVFDYDLEDLLYLNKDTGEITGKKPELVEMAALKFSEALGMRTPGDVTKVVHRLFEKEAKLFPDPHQKGVYFVPDDYRPLLDQIASYLNAVGGSISRYPVPRGDRHGDKAVTITVTAGMDDDIKEHMEAIAAFDLATRSVTFEKQADRIRMSRQRLQAFAEYLGARKEELELVLEEAAERLRAKVTMAETARADARGPEGPPVPAEIAAKRSAAAHKAWDTMRQKQAERAAAAAHAEMDAPGPDELDPADLDRFQAHAAAAADV
jgi:hypothetical protein